MKRADDFSISTSIPRPVRLQALVDRTITVDLVHDVDAVRR